MEELSLGQIDKLTTLISSVTKMPPSEAYQIAKTMDDGTRRYLWAIFYEKKLDEFRRYIKDYKV